MNVQQIIDFVGRIAPLDLAEDWDNVGLLLGDRARDVSSVLTCLTLTPDVAAEAIERNSELIVSHHPILFRSVKRITADNPEGRMLLDLTAARVAVYSPHTGYDSAQVGVNRQLAELLELTDVGVLRPTPTDDESEAVEPVGAGRFGALPQSMKLEALVALIKSRLDIPGIQFVGDADLEVKTIGIACGAAAEFLSDADKVGCQAFLTGEARFHDCLSARSRGMGMVLPGHYATERPAMENLARQLAKQFPDVAVNASQNETDPVQWA